MLYRFVVLIGLAAGALAVAGTPGHAQPRIPIDPTKTMPQQRSATVLLKTSAGACVYIDPGAPNFAKTKTGSQTCDPGDSKLRFKYTVPNTGFMSLQHLDTGLCLAVDPINRTDVAGFACSQTTRLEAVSAAPLRLRQTFYGNPGPPLHRCLRRTSVLRIQADDCTGTQPTVRNFTFVYVQ